MFFFSSIILHLYCICEPDGKNYSDQAYSCPRDLRLSASWVPIEENPLKSPDHPRHYGTEGLRVPPIGPPWCRKERGDFFQSGLWWSMKPGAGSRGTNFLLPYLYFIFLSFVLSFIFSFILSFFYLSFFYISFFLLYIISLYLSFILSEVKERHDQEVTFLLPYLSFILSEK